ncbi:hypothetical protein ACFU5O_34415 [Streptomyces sp. NPDC057445]|uniref:hypothetical protein n=1 Tax=Streptomyces sp. NPDC057445 TaxID=3346136 RepID=UPI00369A6373
MENTEIIIKLTSDEALVLSDWLERVQMTDLSRLVDERRSGRPFIGWPERSTSPCLGSSQRTMANAWTRRVAGFDPPQTISPAIMKTLTELARSITHMRGFSPKLLVDSH